MSTSKNVDEISSVDRIGSLPDSLLYHILSFLNTKVVVQTCVLSKRWRTIWTRIPTFNFDFDSFPLKRLSGDDSSIETSFKHFILRVLSKWSGTCITKLRYSPSDESAETVQVVEWLVCYAGRHMLQELCLDTPVFYKDWPCCLGTCSSLTVLKIACGSVDGWGSLKSPSLRILHIEFDCYSGDNYNIYEKYNGMKMLSGCPNLESLVLVDFHFDSICICAPKLENFELYGCFERHKSFPEVELLAPSLKSVKFCNIFPMVKSASEFLCIDKVNIIAECYGSYETKGSNWQKAAENISELLRVFHNVRCITMPLKAIEVLTLVPSSISGSSFQNLKHLKLTTEKEKKMLNFPNLESFMIAPTRKNSYSRFW